MSKQQEQQRFVFKIHSSRLRKSGWHLTLPLGEARRNDELISLASSQVLRWIDELNDVTDADRRACEIRASLKALRKEEDSTAHRREARRLYSELDAIQFKADYMCLVIDKVKDYWRAVKGFTINGIRYARLLGTNGGIKNSTIVFVSERLHDELERRINNGRNPDIPFVPAKLEAYRALACSASVPVSNPRGVLIVKDANVSFKSDIIYLTDEDVDEPLMEERHDEQIESDATDGFGLMLPSLAKRWSEELGLDYVTSGFNTRFK